MDHDDWLTLDEASRLVRVAPETISALVLVRAFPRPLLDPEGRPRWWRPDLLEWTIDDAIDALRIEALAKRGPVH
jgi:hypothetical protein